jgi:hypothetical protein
MAQRQCAICEKKFEAKTATNVCSENCKQERRRLHNQRMALYQRNKRANDAAYCEAQREYKRQRRVNDQNFQERECARERDKYAADSEYRQRKLEYNRQYHRLGKNKDPELRARLARQERERRRRAEIAGATCE